ncbi:hypothetical protein [Nannocystis punicea]|uniref:PQQ-like domain-containing protein n=1 Tax=Nannocystis punicea TaxID=2995304 RepID=A0ABY7GS10_9BACT|nr:hypothetical protein [Nannocystis poenicansa]WAS89728.1 hypothetical protein O0S08_26345 [Nannocystis poenicansa]
MPADDRRAVVTRRARAFVVGLLIATVSCTDGRRPGAGASPTTTGTVTSEEGVRRELPAVLRVAVVDRDEALLAIADGDAVSLTRVDREAAPRWVQPLPGPVRTDWSDVFAVDGERVIVWGRDIQIRALADGSSRSSISEVPARLIARRDELRPLRPSARDGRLFVPLTDIRSTWITAFDADSGAELWHIERPGQTNLVPLPGDHVRVRVGDTRPLTSDESPEQLEVLHAATGASVWSVMHDGVCEADGWLVAATPDGAVAVWDSERAAPRPSISEVAWPPAGRLADCHRSGDRLWLVVEKLGLLEPSTWTILEPGDSGLRPRLRVSGAQAGTFALGKWLPLLSESPAVGAALLDIEAGRVSWSQDPSVDPSSYRHWSASEEALLLEGHVDRTSTYLAIDRSSGAPLGGVEVSGASLLARGHGLLWFIAWEQERGAPVALAVLDARTLRPVDTPGRGITVTDRGEVIRSAWRTAAPDAGAAWGLVDLTETSSPPRGPRR